MLTIRKIFGLFDIRNLASGRKVTKKLALKPTGFIVEAQDRSKVKLRCDYNPGVWIRQFQYRQAVPSVEDQSGIEWISMDGPGSRTVELLSGLKCGHEYIFRIMHIGRNNERAYSDEISSFILPTDDD